MSIKSDIVQQTASKAVGIELHRADGYGLTVHKIELVGVLAVHSSKRKFRVARNEFLVQDRARVLSWLFDGPTKRVAPSARSHGIVLDKDLTNPHCPMPGSVTGQLVVDPEVSLKTKGFELDIAFY